MVWRPLGRFQYTTTIDTLVASISSKNEESIAFHWKNGFRECGRFNGRRVIRYGITLTDNGDGTTEAEWRQVITGLSKERDRLVDGLTDETYRQRILALERLNHHLTTGEMLRGAA